MSERQTELPIDPQFLQRWSPRAFTGEVLDEATLLSFLEAARWAPSGFNAQPWRFIYARAGTPAWGPIFDTLLPFNQSWVQRASALVLVLSQTDWQAPASKACVRLGPGASLPGACHSDCDSTSTRAEARCTQLWLKGSRVSKIGPQAGVPARA